MAKIKTIPERDVFGNGYKQEITFDNGKSYKIQTTTERDVFGDGYKKEIADTEATVNALGFLGHISRIGHVCNRINGIYRRSIFNL